jgi:voltage-dependent potassium channel beta subunit
MPKQMEYRRLGRSGLKLSALSFGSWVSFGPQLDVGRARDCLAAAYEAGVNFFDNAQSYAGGESERIMGKAIANLGWPRNTYVLSTKVYWGMQDRVNLRMTLNRKYLMQAVDGCLERLGVDFVDVLFCHRSDPNTPIEETVWAMSDIIADGKALYWGTSEWSADEIRAACEIAERHHLRAPVTEQPQYNLFERERVEKEYARIFADLGYGTTIWSPLASGLLTGKYLDGIPDDSRAALPGYEWLRGRMTSEDALDRVRRLKSIADDIGCSVAQLSLAWCAANRNVSTVILGASKLDQLKENLGSMDVLPQVTSEVKASIDEIFS